MKRQGLASELADLIHRQQTIVACAEASHRDIFPGLAAVIGDELEQDRHDLAMLKTAATAFGVWVEPKCATRMLAAALASVVVDETYAPSERLAAFNLLRQAQAIGAQALRKMTQLAADDVRLSLSPLLTVQAHFARKAVETAKAAERYCVGEVMGEAPIGGVTGHLLDASAAVAGKVAGVFAKPLEELSVLEVLRQDHDKIRILFKELDDEADPRQREGLFRQIRVDLRAHCEAEEQVVYDRFAGEDADDRLEEARSDHEALRDCLDEMDSLSPSDADYESRLAELQSLTEDHMAEEEQELFGVFRDHGSHEEMIHLAGQYAVVKRAVQERLAAMAGTRPTPFEPDAPAPWV